MPKIFISTLPFGEGDSTSLDLLRATGWDVLVNPTGRKLTAEEVGGFCADADALIAGTEKIATVLERAKSLKIIARVGIGLDSVPLRTCRDLGIAVTYTPDAVTMAVAEAALGAMVILARRMHAADKAIRKNTWKRPVGRRIGDSVIGLAGLGRIGTQVVRLLGPFVPREILVHDLRDMEAHLAGLARENGLRIRQASLEEVLRTSHLVSLHLPYSAGTRHLIDGPALDLMQPEAFLINYARGGIVDEAALCERLKDGRLAGAALDCFEQEPYSGPLCELDNVLLTPHLGSSSLDCRARMELEAAEEVIRFFRSEPLKNPVPPFEYENQE